MTLWQDWTPQQKQQTWKRWYRKRRFAERMQRAKEKKLMKPLPSILKIILFTLTAITLVALLQGCALQPPPHVHYANDAAIPVPPQWTWQQCNTLSMKQLATTIVGTGAGVLGGTVTAVSPAVQNNDTGRYSMIGVGSVLALTGSITGLIASFYSKQYTQLCTTNTGGK